MGGARVTLTPGLRGRLGPLQEGPFRLLWIGQTTSAVGDSLIPVGIAFTVLGLGGNASGIGLVLAAFTLPRVLLVLVGGVWADRLPRNLVMVSADVVRGSVELVLAILLLTGAAQFWEVVAAAALVGAASAFFVPATTGLIQETVSDERRQQANALMGLSRSASNIIGPSVAGVMVATVGTGWLFLIDAATFAVSAASLLALHVRPVPVETGRRFLADLVDGWREVTSRRWLLASILTFGLGNVALGPFFVLGPVVAHQRLGGAAPWGIIVTAMGVGGLAGGLLALRWRPRHPLRAAFLIGFAFSLPTLSLAPPLALPAIMLAGFLSTVSSELINTWWYTVLQQRIAPEAMSRVSSYDWLVSIVFQPVGFAAAGPVATVIGAGATLVGAAALDVAASIGVLSVRDVRDLEWLSDAAEVPPEGQGTTALVEGEPAAPPPGAMPGS
jgi:MFS family permease